MPGLLRRAVNLAGAVVKHVTTGMKTVSDEERSRRLALCMACEFYVNGKCGKCGCPATTAEGWVDKLRWSDQHCPLPVPKW